MMHSVEEAAISSTEAATFGVDVAAVQGLPSGVAVDQPSTQIHLTRAGSSPAAMAVIATLSGLDASVSMVKLKTTPLNEKAAFFRLA